MSIMAALMASGKTHSFEQVFGVRDLTSEEMQKAIKDWFELYYACEPTKQEDPCQRIPNAIVNKLTKTVFSEYQAEAAHKAAGGEYVQAVLLGLDKVKEKSMQKALIGGLAYLKPLLNLDGTVSFSVISRDHMVVLGRDETGAVSSVGTAERTVHQKRYYTLMERRTLDAKGYLTLENRLYVSSEAHILGVEIPLTSLECYARLMPSYTYPQPVHSLGIVPVQVPMVNCVDGGDDPVSVYAPAVGLLHNINRNEALLNGEFERGQSRIIASSDLLETDKGGKKKVFADNLFVAVEDDPDRVGVTIFSPALREQSFLARKTEYLRNVESLIGLKRGLLSEVEASERTAKEITSSEGDYNLTIIDFQRMWELAVREAVRVCSVLGKLYHVYSGPEIDPEKDIVIRWGNGILYDEDKVWSELTGMVASGLLKPEIAVGWYFDQPTGTEADLVKIREKYMPEVESMLEPGDGA